MSGNLKKYSCYLLLIFTLLGNYSCEKECPEGFYGKDCEDRESDSFIGSYEGFVNCGFTNQFTEIEIYRDQGPYAVFIDFISTPDFVLEGSTKGDSLLVPSQWIAVHQPPDSIYYLINRSSGHLLNDTLTIPINIKYPGDPSAEWLTCFYQVYK